MCHPEQVAFLGAKQNKPKDLCASAHFDVNSRWNAVYLYSTHQSDNINGFATTNGVRGFRLRRKGLRLLVAIYQYSSHAQNDTIQGQRRTYRQTVVFAHSAILSVKNIVVYDTTVSYTPYFFPSHPRFITHRVRFGFEAS